MSTRTSCKAIVTLVIDYDELLGTLSAKELAVELQKLQAEDETLIDITHVSCLKCEVFTRDEP